MRLIIDNKTIEANTGETLLSLIERAGFADTHMADKPLAAQIGGEVFHLNYVPVRLKDGVETPRTAVINSGGTIELLRCADTMGRRVYERTLLFVFILAVRKKFPGARVLVQYALGQGLYVQLDKSPALTEADTQLLKEECLRIIDADLPLERERLDIEDAIAFFNDDGQIDKVRLLQWRKFSYFDVYRQSGYMDYFYGEMAPSTAYAKVFDLAFVHPGLVLLLPDHENPDVPAKYHHSPKLFAVFAQSDDWGRLLHCANVADLNDMVANHRIRELVRVSEALHEKSYAMLADRIVERGARAVLLSGPSSSGKTTSANRLYTQLRVLGKSPVLLSLDDYYIDRDRIPRDENGEVDLEHINTIDTEQFRKDLELLLAGEPVEIPKFDFLQARRAPKGHLLQVGPDEPLIIEGIHGLNPLLLSPSIPMDSIFRVYVSALTTLNLDDHNRIRTTDMRLLRRMVRDFETRGASVEKTLSMWPSVRRGEDKWIFPYQEQADAFFNTALVYEPAVLKKHIFPLLKAVPEESPYFNMARDLVKFLNYFADAEIEDEVPPTSILREFIGGNAFYKKFD